MCVDSQRAVKNKDLTAIPAALMKNKPSRRLPEAFAAVVVALLVSAIKPQIAIPICGLAITLLYSAVSLGWFSCNQDSRRTERRVFLGVQTVFSFLVLMRMDVLGWIWSLERRDLSWSGLVKDNSLLEPLASPYEHREVLFAHVIFIVGFVGAAWLLDNSPMSWGLFNRDGFLDRRPIIRMVTGAVLFFSIMWCHHCWVVPMHCKGIPLYYAEDELSLVEQSRQLIGKWRLYHRPEFMVVRFMHSLTYPSMLHGAIGGPKRQNYVSYAWWALSRIYIAGHMLADWAHYADSPVVAGIRLEYDDELCTSVARVFFRTLFGHPLNAYFLVFE